MVVEKMAGWLNSSTQCVHCAAKVVDAAFEAAKLVKA